MLNIIEIKIFKPVHDAHMKIHPHHDTIEEGDEEDEDDAGASTKKHEKSSKSFFGRIFGSLSGNIIPASCSPVSSSFGSAGRCLSQRAVRSTRWEELSWYGRSR